MNLSKPLALAVIGAFVFAWTPARADTSMDAAADTVSTDTTGSTDSTSSTDGTVLPDDSAATNCDGTDATVSRC